MSVPSSLHETSILSACRSRNCRWVHVPSLFNTKPTLAACFTCPLPPSPNKVAKRLGLGKPFIHFSPNLFRASTSICSFQCMAIYHVSSYMSIESWDFSPEKTCCFCCLAFPTLLVSPPLLLGSQDHCHLGAFPSVGCTGVYFTQKQPLEDVYSMKTWQFSSAMLVFWGCKLVSHFVCGDSLKHHLGYSFTSILLISSLFYPSMMLFQDALAEEPKSLLRSLA